MIKNIVFSPRKRLLSVFVCDTIPRDEGFALIFLCGTGKRPTRSSSARGGTQPPSSGGAALFRTKNLGEGGLSPKQSGGKKSFPSKKSKIAGENNGPQVIL